MEIFKKVIDYFKGILDSKDKKKLVENALIIIIIGVIIIIAGSSFWGKGKNEDKQPSPKENTATEVIANNVSSDEKNDLDKKVESILSQIEGAGKVNVMITFVSGKEIVPASDSKKSENTTAEKDNGGGTRNIDQREYDSKIAYEEGQGGAKKPIILKELQPAVKGVVVVADGAVDPTVKENLSRAVSVLLDVPVHKVQVFERVKK